VRLIDLSTQHGELLLTRLHEQLGRLQLCLQIVHCRLEVNQLARLLLVQSLIVGLLARHCRRQATTLTIRGDLQETDKERDMVNRGGEEGGEYLGLVVALGGIVIRVTRGALIVALALVLLLLLRCLDLRHSILLLLSDVLLDDIHYRGIASGGLNLCGKGVQGLEDGVYRRIMREAQVEMEVEKPLIPTAM